MKRYTAGTFSKCLTTLLAGLVFAATADNAAAGRKRRHYNRRNKHGRVRTIGHTKVVKRIGRPLSGPRVKTLPHTSLSTRHAAAVAALQNPTPAPVVDSALLELIEKKTPEQKKQANKKENESGFWSYPTKK